MLHFDLLTLFPELFRSFLSESLIGKALEKQLFQVEMNNFREFGLGPHHQVDDEPFGGGPGMLLRVEPIAEALEKRVTHHQQKGRSVRRILLTPQGKPFDQEKATEWSRSEEVLLLVCGRYEGFDERVRELVDEEVSGGDYVCLGGEVIAMLIIESVSRLVPGVLGNPDSPETESFAANLLEYPQYTRPRNYKGMEVPEELLSGNHSRIQAWRETRALERTRQRRPDLTTRSIE